MIVNLLVGITLSSLIGVLAYRKRALSRSGVLGAILTGGAIFGGGGWVWGMLLIAFFTLSSLLSHYKERAKAAVAAEKFDKGSRRDLGQALANGGAGALLALGYALHPHPAWFCAFVGALATVNADTWATEIGVLSRRPPRLITTGQVVEPGTSGGITLLGTLATLAGGLIIGVAALAGLVIDGVVGGPGLALTGVGVAVGLPLLGALAGLAGSLSDSLLGATVQAIYYSPVRHKETEKVIDPDGTPNQLRRGWRWLTNDWVNFGSSLAGAAVGVGLWSLMRRMGGFFLAKFLPLFLYPPGLACLLLGIAWLVRHPRWKNRLLAAALALIWLSGNRLVSMSVVRSLEWRYLTPTPLPQAEAIVLLGGATYVRAYPRPTYELNHAGDRLLYAATLYREGKAPLVLLSGGGAEWKGPEYIPEADMMAEILVEIGAPREALLLERHSANTHENALASAELLRARGIRRVLLVTSALHMPRALAEFTATGLEVIPAPTDFTFSQAEWNAYTQPTFSVQVFNLVPTAEYLLYTTRALKEYLGLGVYWLRQWL